MASWSSDALASGNAVIGTTLSPQETERRFEAAIEKRFHAHALRHTHAAQLRAEHVDIGIISKQLGHALIATTVRYLDHIAPVAVVEAMRGRVWPAS